MATTQQTLVIPNNYTSQQADIARRKKLADAMLQQGLATDPNMRSWAQVLGKLAQTWVGKSMDKDADKSEAALNATILQDYGNRRTAFQTDAQTMTPQQLVEKYGNDPMLANELKPYQEAFGTGLKQGQELTQFGGRMVRKGDVVGQYDNDPNKMVFVGPDGQTSLNPVAVTAAGISSGNLTPTGGYQTTGQMPGVGRLIGAMGGQPPAQQPGPMTVDQGAAALSQAAQAHGISATDALHVRQSLGPNGQAAFGKWMQDNGIKVHVTTPQEASQFPSGTPLILPDGTEGRVP